MGEIIQFGKFRADETSMTFEVEFIEEDEETGLRPSRGTTEVTLPLNADDAAIEIAIQNARTPGMLARARVEDVVERLNAPKPDDASDRP